MKKPSLIALGLLAISSMGVHAEDYKGIAPDLSEGVTLLEVAQRAYSNAGEYWNDIQLHEHPQGVPYENPGQDEELSAYEAVKEIFDQSHLLNSGYEIDKDSLDIVDVTIAVIDAWPNCADTFEAVQHAVEMQPERAAEIIAHAATKKDCNCGNAGRWVQQRVDDRLRPDLRHALLDVPLSCSCSQVAMFAGISGLPENKQYDPNASAEQQQIVSAIMTERVQEAIDRTASLQSKNDWQCGCVDVNIASTMSGIQHEDLRGQVYDGIAEKYIEDSAETGLVIDSFGIVGRHPLSHWGDQRYSTQNTVLHRKPEIFQGDNLVKDAFSPVSEWSVVDSSDISGLGGHLYSSDYIPNDIFISEYMIGDASTEDEDDYLRVVELYNGTDETVDLQSNQYILEIYSPERPKDDVDSLEDGYIEGVEDPREIIGLNGAIEPGETFVISYKEAPDEITDQSQLVSEQLNFVPNDTIVLRRFGGERLQSCRATVLAYVTNYPVGTLLVRPPQVIPPTPYIDVASPN